MRRRMHPMRILLLFANIQATRLIVPLMKAPPGSYHRPAILGGTLPFNLTNGEWLLLNRR